MIDDKELLKLAAKAADYGFTYKRKISNDAHEWTNQDGMLWQWNPLIDDAQALRLAVKLRLRFSTVANQNDYAVASATDFDTWASVEPHNNDPYAATRRAIVRAAASIGEKL